MRSQTKHSLPQLRDFQETLYQQIGREYAKGNRAVQHKNAGVKA